MWRTRAVTALLMEEIAGVQTSMPRDDAAGAEPNTSEAEALRRACRRAQWVVILDGLALAALFLFREPSRPFLPWGPTVDSVFTIGALAVAAHAGFRWAQLEKFRAVARVCEELRSRVEP